MEGSAMNVRNRIAPVTLTASLILAACGGGDTPAETVTEPGVELESTAVEADGGTAETASSQADVAEADGQVVATDSADQSDNADRSQGESADAGGPSAASTPIATRDFQVPAGIGDDATIEVRIDVLELTRGSGDTTRLDFVVTNLDDTKAFDLWHRLGVRGSSRDVSGVTLIDYSENLRYYILEDANGVCVCTRMGGNPEIPAGDSLAFSAVFPAPPAETEVVDVQFPFFGLLPDVAVTG